MEQWISVKERLPKSCTGCLIYHKKRKTTLRAVIYNDGYRKRTYHFNVYDVNGSNRIELDEVSHWQPLPNPPKQ